MNSIELHRLASIRTGYTLRDKIVEGTQGEVLVIQPRDIVDGRLRRPSSCSSQEFQGLEKHLLKSGDILISNKGVRFNVYRHSEDDKPYIATSAFFVITPTTMVLPTFLEWYLNLPSTLARLESYLSHSTIPTLTKKDLERLEIFFLSIDDQKKIEAVVDVTSKEIEVLRDLILKKEEYRNSVGLELMKL